MKLESTKLLAAYSVSYDVEYNVAGNDTLAGYAGLRGVADYVLKNQEDLTREEILEVRNQWMNEPQTFADRDAQAEGYARMLIAAYKEKNSIK